MSRRPKPLTTAQWDLVWSAVIAQQMRLEQDAEQARSRGRVALAEFFDRELADVNALSQAICAHATCRPDYEAVASARREAWRREHKAACEAQP